MIKLYQPKDNENPNDPVMLSPKGVEMQVPEGRVEKLLAKGFELVDKSWMPTVEREETVTRTQPKPKSNLQEQISIEQDMLEITEV